MSTKIWLYGEPPYKCSAQKCEGFNNRKPPKLSYNLDLLCTWQLNTASFCENYAKLYFDAKHSEKGLNRGWWNFRCLESVRGTVSHSKLATFFEWLQIATVSGTMVQNSII